ncbi:hypothetical protein J3R30DRAFT_3873875 [Lentinula aciculospora]|uniref:BZIP domain-containing protein n=1 Tax=Lentinula aciculospora TaxID=153920 RepID=A0A9W9AE68_9AGAR|nr:hypothetical protein J3R30DRAFT_3873875 [Lentinula aciculospora]
MSSKRGRKRNDNLPPNRARDVQRAFRARRAAHLQALEQRVSELEEENNCLRQALNLPPANRPLLGKGPTGKDKPKTYNTPNGLTTMSLNSRGSSDSPPSTRMSSQSPESAIVGLDDPAWDQTIVMSDTHSDLPSSSASSSYPLPPMSAPPSSKYIQYNPYPPPSRSSSVSGPVYMNSQPTYVQSTDRSMSSSSYPSPTFPSIRLDARQEARTPYSYSHSPYDSDSLVQNAPPSAPPHMHSQRDPSLSYPTRRSITEPYNVDVGYSHLPNPISQHPIHGPSPPQPQDNGVGHHSQLTNPRHLYDTTPEAIARTPSMS